MHLQGKKLPAFNLNENYYQLGDLQMATLIKQAKRGNNKVLVSSYIGSGCCAQAFGAPQLAYISVDGYRLYMSDKEELKTAIRMMQRQLATLEEIETSL